VLLWDFDGNTIWFDNYDIILGRGLFSHFATKYTDASKLYKYKNLNITLLPNLTQDLSSSGEKLDT